MVMEGCYKRSVEEHPAEEVNDAGEVVRRDQKIRFWRAAVPGARGMPGVNLITAMRRVQIEWRQASAAADRRPFFLMDLCGWRQSDLQEWMAHHPGRAPSEVFAVAGP